MSNDSTSNLDIKTELEQLKSELAISEKLGEKARQRQLELEESNAKLKDEILLLKENVGNTKKMEDVIAGLKKQIEDMKAANPSPKEFRETSKLVVTLQEENDKLKQELREVTNQ